MSKIEEFLIDKGIKTSNKGFICLVEAIKLVQKDKSYKYNVTTRLYPDIAKNLDETASKVERAIRHELFRAKIMLTNREFISRAVLELKAN